MAWNQDRVGYFASSTGGAGFLMYTENDSASNIAGRISRTGGAFQNAEVKAFIEQQRSGDYTATTAAGAGVPVCVLGTTSLEWWTLYIDANGDVARGASNFINT